MNNQFYSTPAYSTPAYSKARRRFEFANIDGWHRVRGRCEQGHDQSDIKTRVYATGGILLVRCFVCGVLIAVTRTRSRPSEYITKGN